MAFSILSCGAVGNGVTNDGPAIQKAIDACSAAGGGRVLVDGGRTYLCGTIFMKSNVELHLEAGAVIKASADAADYLPLENLPQGHTLGPVEGMPNTAVLCAKDVQNIQVTGFGTIDGSMESFSWEESKYILRGFAYPRPPLVFFENCSQVTVRDVTLANSAFWTLHPVGCRDMTIDNVRILNSLQMANSDGIDPDHCQNVRITNCHIVCGDDGICLKTTKRYTKYGPTESIVVSGCTIISTSAAIKIGTEGVDDFRNIIIQNCIVNASSRGISLQIRDKGNVENVVFENIMLNTRRFSDAWWGSAEPVYITSIPRTADTTPGKISHIRFSRIICQGENGVFIYGCTPDRIDDVSFDDLRVTLTKESKWEPIGYDLRPPLDMEWLHSEPACIRIMNAGQISIKNVQLSPGEHAECAFDNADVTLIE